MQRCRLSVDPRGTAVTVTGRSQRTRIRSGIFDFRSVNLIQIRSKEPAPLFENNIDIYREVSKDTVTGPTSITLKKTEVFGYIYLAGDTAGFTKKPSTTY